VERLLAGVLAASLWLTGCSADKPPPTPLEDYTPRIAGRQVWERSLGSLPTYLSVGVSEGRFVLASRGGDILRIDAATGTQHSRVSIRGRVAAGVGADDRFAAVVTDANELVVVDARQERWRLQLSSPVVTAPLVAGGRVFILAVDRRVEAYDVLDGRKLWSYARPGDPLALSQPGVLQPYKDTLLVGIGSRLVGLDPLQGTVRSDVTVATPRGTNEVERLADLVGPSARLVDTFCVRSFQVAVACLNADRATLLWSRNQGGFQGVAVDADQVYAADSSDRISVWKRSSGDLVWTSERLRHRGLSAPLAMGGTVVFGDADGWLHVLGRDRGDTQLRLRTDGSPIVAPLVRAGSTLLAVTRKGGLYAFRPE
jgi:outer membrane assembly lipoprotein YfgL